MNENQVNIDWSEYDEDYSLWVFLDQLQSLIRRVRDKELRSNGLLFMQSAILNVLIHFDRPMAPAEIGRHMFREANSISYILRRMEKVGLITISDDETKKNQLRVIITDAGLKAQSLSQDRTSMHTIFGDLTAHQRSQLRAIFTKLWRRALLVGGYDVSREIPKYH